MPIQVSYPGVYVNVITTSQPPTGGASTSIAAFVGRTPTGPQQQATLVLNFADYVSKFGGLDQDSAISYQANAFFSNGGAQAVVVRLYSPPTSTVLEIGGDDPVAADIYTLDYAIDGIPQAALTVTGKTAAADVAATFSTTIAATEGLKDLVTANNVAGTKQVTISIASSAITQTITFSTATSKSSLTMALAGPSIIANGTATIPIHTQVQVAVGGTIAIGDVFQLIFTPPGSPATTLSFTATTTAAADVATGLAGLVAGNSVTKRLVSATANDANVILAFLSAVEITTQVTSEAGTLTSTDQSITQADGANPVTGTGALFSLTAANPGVWGDQIIASIATISASTASGASLYQRYGLDSTKPSQRLFNLAISYFDGTQYQSERFLNVTLYGDDNQVNRLDKVLANGSRYVRYTAPSPNAPTGIPDGTIAVGFAAGGADSATLQDTDYLGDANALTGLYALNQLPYGFNILCVPSDDIADEQGGDQNAEVYQEAAQICVDNNAMLIIDPPTNWYGLWQSGQVTNISIDDPQLGSYTAEQGRSATIYFPRVVIADPLMNGHPKILPPCGFMAAAWATTDAASGIWKAPAGLDVPIAGITGLQANLTDDDNGQLNPQGINVLRSFGTSGNVVWGARTLRGSDVLGDEYKYLPVRRLLLYIATSLQQDSQWAVFQPNGPSLWARLQTQVNTFMTGLFSQGAFAGTSASQAFFVKCDATTTTATDQASGIVNVQVGFAPLYPAEFVVITVSQQQTAAQSG